MQAVLRRADTLLLFAWALSGFCAVMAAFAMTDQGYGLTHLSLCLSGKAPLFGPDFALGHCAWCWAAAGSAFAALALTAQRRNRHH